VRSLGQLSRRVLGSIAAAIATAGVIAAPAHAWEMATVPVPAGVAAPVLTGVSCVTSGACVAVGNGTAGSQTFGVASGAGGWRAATIGHGADPATVSCVTARFCLALGGAASSVVYRWNGRAWARSSTGLPASARLTGVSCVSRRFCMAVGSSDGVAREPLAAVFNGTRWRLGAPQLEGGAGSLNVVACPAAKVCFAVGDYEVSTSGGSFQTHQLVERWNGHWVNQHVGDFRKLSEGGASISCAGVSSCMVVGSDTPQHLGLPEPFAERWNGHRWLTSLAGLPAQVQPPATPTVLAQFAGVSCWKADACLAVGSSHANQPGVTSGPLVMQWDGRRWQDDPTAVPLGGEPDLLGVSCLRGGTCTIVGARGSAALAESGREVISDTRHDRSSG
jgi:hypothetical protein